MLLRIGFGNFYSFRKYAEISMEATFIKGDESYHLPCTFSKHGVRSVMAIFGANASGKSNALRALSIIQSEVLNSYTDRKKEESIPSRYFLLDQSSKEEPTQLDCDFVVDGVRYHYGFTYDQNGFVEEWLYAWPKNRKQVWFERDRENKDEPWKFGSKLKGRKDILLNAVKDNALFLSVASISNELSDQLEPILDFIEDLELQTVEVSGLHAIFPVFSQNSAIVQEENREFLIEALQKADLGLADIDIERNAVMILHELLQVKDQSILERVPLQELKTMFEDAVWVKLLHSGIDGQKALSIGAESRGTNMFLIQLNLAIEALQAGSILCIDELDSSLHPDLMKFYIELFANSELNPNGAQLIFTTHEAEILNELKQDQIILIEKDLQGCSSLAYVSDYKTKSRDDLERLYRKGHLGARPILGTITKTIEVKGGA